MPGSPEEKAFNRMRTELSSAKPVQTVISFQIPQSVLDEAIIETVRMELRHNAVLGDFIADKIREYVKELAPESEQIRGIKEEVRQHLARYPSIDADPELQKVVAMAIFEHIQGPNNTYR